MEDKAEVTFTFDEGRGITVKKDSLANNPVLHKMVTGNFLEGKSERIHMPGTRRKSFLVLLELIQHKHE